MHFDLKKFLETAKTPYTSSFFADLTKADFDGFSVGKPVQCSFRAQPTLDGVAITLGVQATVEAECARCLAPVTESYGFSVDYLVRPADLQDPDFELPLDQDGCLDVQELAYQELIFQVPRVLLCSPDCKGLCPICGKRKAAGCSCQPAGQAAPADARLSILKQLLS